MADVTINYLAALGRLMSLQGRRASDCDGRPTFKASFTTSLTEPGAGTSLENKYKFQDFAGRGCLLKDFSRG